MIGRRRPGRDRGAFTVELAAGLPALLLLMLAGMTAMSAMSTRMQCLDAAREVALAVARGEPSSTAARFAPPGADVRTDVGRDTVTVEVTARVRLVGAELPTVTVRGSAVAAREPDEVAA
ncbi:TadE family type IV pilus minor pilin [Actinoplanes rectilineatus]|uniref:TadE family type IV pilus minor pilin n=1 Tax=Actinoplanes rectilineatus TaxID=113571 RepID=UPI0005F287EA|nr:TadE family type IV pilus minor pilin [Actinoplanes rectilineatus]